MNKQTAISAARPTLLGMTPEELSERCVQLGAKPFVGKQIAGWIYQRGARTFDERTNVSASLRRQLAERYDVCGEPPARSQRSADGTVKYLFPVSGGRYVESVFIPDGERGTLCVSSQVGCKMGCTFCMTGRQGFEAQLSVAEILNQLHSLPERERLTNVVFMGQGEPMDNLDAVLRATEVLTAPWGWAWSPRRITVSTVGVRRGLERFLRESECHLAVSLHSPFPAEREALIPAQKAFTAADIIALLETYPPFRRQRQANDDSARQRRLSFEYTVFAGVNDTPRHARALVRLLSRLNCRVNLIRFHAIPGSPLRGATDAQMTAFRDSLTHAGLFATIRDSRGEDILAACGLLNTAENVKH